MGGQLGCLPGPQPRLLGKPPAITVRMPAHRATAGCFQAARPAGLPPPRPLTHSLPAAGAEDSMRRCVAQLVGKVMSDAAAVNGA